MLSKPSISEDLADGQTARLDASLGILSEDDQELLIHGDDRDDDDIHINEITHNAGSRNHAIQDQRMKIKHLEQEKKRAQMATRYFEQDCTQFDYVAAATETRRRYKTDAIQKEQTQAAGTQKSLEIVKQLQSHPRRPQRVPMQALALQRRDGSIGTDYSSRWVQ